MLFALFFLLIAASSNAIQLNCRYLDQNWIIAGNIYTCAATINNSGNGTAVTGVSQNHLSGRTDINVQAVTLNNNSLTFLPSNIDEFFPNLRVIQMINTNLKSLISDDLKPFPRLEAIGFYNNQIETLDGDLFEHTPLLQHINFAGNSLTNVGPNIFTPVPLLRQMHLSGNLCTQEIANSTSEVLRMSLRLRYQCPPSREMIERLILSGQEFERKVDEHTADRINPAVLRIHQNEQRIDELEQMLTELMAKA